MLSRCILISNNSKCNISLSVLMRGIFKQWFFFIQLLPKYHTEGNFNFLGPVHFTPEEFENKGFTLNTHQIFTAHTTPGKFENWRNNHRSFLTCVWQKVGAGKYRDYGKLAYFDSFVFRTFSMFLSHGDFKFSGLSFRKVRDSVEKRFNRRNKATISNSACVMCTDLMLKFFVWGSARST